MSSIGDTNVTGNTVPFDKATAFKPWLTNYLRELTGKKSVPVTVVDEYQMVERDIPLVDGQGEAIKDSEGNQLTQHVQIKVPLKTHDEWQEVRDKNIIELMNDKGANWYKHKLSSILNIHSAMGKLTHDEVVRETADLADDITVQAIINDIDFEIKSLSLVVSEMKTILKIGHNFLSSTEDGGMQEFGKTLGNPQYQPPMPSSTPQGIMDLRSFNQKA